MYKRKDLNSQELFAKSVLDEHFNRICFHSDDDLLTKSFINDIAYIRAMLGEDFKQIRKSWLRHYLLSNLKPIVSPARYSPRFKNITNAVLNNMEAN